MSTHLPSVRGDALLLTHGRLGAAEDLLLISAAMLLDAVLGGQLDVSGSRKVGLDRRRIAPGPATTGAPLLLELRARALQTAGETPWGWLERAAVLAPRASEELIASGSAERALPDALARMFRHRTLRVHPELELEARERLADVLTGRPAPPHVIALASALHSCDVLDDVAGVRVTRPQLRAMADATHSLGSGARALLATLEERRRRADTIAA
jgi:hypothetical protein